MLPDPKSVPEGTIVGEFQARDGRWVRLEPLHRPEAGPDSIKAQTHDPEPLHRPVGAGEEPLKK